jgi:hypothetical protein
LGAHGDGGVRPSHHSRWGVSAATSISLNELAVAVLLRQRGKRPERGLHLQWQADRLGQHRRLAQRPQACGDRQFPLARPAPHWASCLVQNGTPLCDLQEMGGWKSAEMVRRYAHLAPAQMAKHAAVIDALLYDTTTSQRDSSGQQKGATDNRTPLI